MFPRRWGALRIRLMNARAEPRGTCSVPRISRRDFRPAVRNEGLGFFLFFGPVVLAGRSTRFWIPKYDESKGRNLAFAFLVLGQLRPP